MRRLACLPAEPWSRAYQTRTWVSRTITSFDAVEAECLALQVPTRSREERQYAHDLHLRRIEAGSRSRRVACGLQDGDGLPAFRDHDRLTRLRNPIHELETLGLELSCLDLRRNGHGHDYGHNGPLEQAEPSTSMASSPWRCHSVALSPQAAYEIASSGSVACGADRANGSMLGDFMRPRQRRSVEAASRIHLPGVPVVCSSAQLCRRVTYDLAT